MACQLKLKGYTIACEIGCPWCGATRKGGRSILANRGIVEARSSIRDIKDTVRGGTISYRRGDPCEGENRDSVVLACYHAPHGRSGIEGDILVRAWGGSHEIRERSEKR
jgi:hypothetical protein